MSGTDVGKYHTKYNAVDNKVQTLKYGPEKRWDNHMQKQSERIKEANYQKLAD